LDDVFDSSNAFQQLDQDQIPSRRRYGKRLLVRRCPGPKAGDEYKYVIQNLGTGPDNPGGEQWRTDPCAYDVPDSNTDSSSIIVRCPAEMARTGLDRDSFATPNPPT